MRSDIFGPDLPGEVKDVIAAQADGLDVDYGWWIPDDTQPAHRGEVPMRLLPPRGMPLPPQITWTPGRLRIAVDAGEIRGLTYDQVQDLLDGLESAAVRFDVDDRFVIANSEDPGEYRYPVTASCDLLLRRDLGPVPVTVLADLCRRRVVAFLTRVCSLATEPQHWRTLSQIPGGAYSGMNLAPDRASLAATLPVLTGLFGYGMEDAVADDIRAKWARADVGIPYVPSVMAEHVAVLGDWWWGTVPPLGRSSKQMEQYMLFLMVDRYQDGDTAPRFGLSHFGHGFNSYSINYELVTDHLAVFAQTGFGGVYMDPVAARARVRLLSFDVELLHRMLAAVPMEPGAALLVAASDFRGDFFEWLPRQASLPFNLSGSLAASQDNRPGWDVTGLMAAAITVEERLWARLGQRDQPARRH